MTIIVYRAGWCFADELIHAGDAVVGRSQKIAWRKRDGAIIAASGACYTSQKFLAGAMRAKMPEDNGTRGEDACVGAVFKKDHSAHYYGGAIPWTMGADFYCMGSAQEVATGALLMGADAAEACAAACIAMGWASGLHGVNHFGEWKFVSLEDVFKPVHAGRIPSAIIKPTKAGHC